MRCTVAGSDLIKNIESAKAEIRQLNACNEILAKEQAKNLTSISNLVLQADVDANRYVQLISDGTRAQSQTSDWRVLLSTNLLKQIQGELPAVSTNTSSVSTDVAR